MPNRDFGRGARSWGYDEPSGRGEWEGGPYGGRYGNNESYFRGGYIGGAYGYREPGYGGAYYGREPGYGGEYTAYYGRLGGANRESYFGRGPRGYRRSDERIREEINDRLTWHPDIDASDIEVRVENGEATLIGVVEDRRAKRLAADIADDVFGIQDVHNQLKVRHGLLAGLTGEKADERELSRTTEREGTETPARRGMRPGATGARTTT
jgi:BON domain-containing protein